MPIGTSGRVLVVGGTAILRPAVVTLTAAGRPVVVLSRSRDRLTGLPAGASGIVGDLEDPPALERALAGLLRSAAGLAYLPDAAGPSGTSSLAVLRNAVAGPLVVVLTSAAAAAGPAPVDLAAVRENLAGRLSGAGTAPGDLRLLLLGWRAATAASATPGADAVVGITRWHTPAEISAAALACLADPAPALLGVVRPWSARPG